MLVRYAYMVRWVMGALAIMVAYIAGLLFAVYGWTWMVFAGVLACLLVAFAALMTALQASELTGIDQTLRETETALRGPGPDPERPCKCNQPGAYCHCGGRTS